MYRKRIDSLPEKTGSLVINNNEILFLGQKATHLTKKFGSPLYIYCEDIIRTSCRKLKTVFHYPDFTLNYSVKSNSNVNILKIIHEEGFGIDTVSPAEIALGLKAGIPSNKILFISNNVSIEEFNFAVKNKVVVSVNSLGQLDLFGRHFPGEKIAIRINPGFGDGHHENVVTGGTKTKFGVELTQLEEIKEIAQHHALKICGLNVHIGSNFMDYRSYVAASKVILGVASHFKDLDFIDFGGGLGISYQEGDKVLDIEKMGMELRQLCDDFTEKYGKQLQFIMEPGRYLVAESGILLTTVNDIKENTYRSFIGTDTGFNILLRPTLYQAYHEIVNCRNVTGSTNPFDICGNICESGDLLAENWPMTHTEISDVLAILDVGAYGYSMASNYNSRPRPAEVLLQRNGKITQIRRRDRLGNLIENQLVV
ncbi:MAG: diaminopimelate decarboxylase [Desulforhopalus sp.]